MCAQCMRMRTDVHIVYNSLQARRLRCNAGVSIITINVWTPVVAKVFYLMEKCSSILLKIHRLLKIKLKMAVDLKGAIVVVCRV